MADFRWEKLDCKNHPLAGWEPGEPRFRGAGLSPFVAVAAKAAASRSTPIPAINGRVAPYLDGLQFLDSLNTGVSP